MKRRNIITATVAGLLGGTAAVPAVAAAASPDAELIALCARFDELERQYDTADAECERFVQQQDPLVKRIFELRAVSPEGQAARARSAVLWAPDLMEEWRLTETHDILVSAILRDLIAAVPLPAGAVPLPVRRNPDAALFARCAEFHQLHAAACSVPEDDDEALTEAMRRRWDVSCEIEGMTAATLSGLRSKAAVGLVIFEENHDGPPSDSDERFAYETLRDVVGRAGI